MRPLALLGLLLAGCGDNAQVPECPPLAVYAAQTCIEGVVACQAPGGAPVEGCFLSLLHAPGDPYEAICVASCSEVTP